MEIHFTRHARIRMAEFGLNEQAIVVVLRDYENRYGSRRNGEDQKVFQKGPWAVVTAPLRRGDGVLVITVLRRQSGRWEHS
jgi:hypothetical protein